MSSAKKAQNVSLQKLKKQTEEKIWFTKNVYITITYIILETFIEEAI